MERPQADPLDITDRTNYDGGFYELEVLLGEKDSARLEAAYHACWSFPELDAPYLRRDIPLTEQTITVPTFERIQHPNSYSIAHIPERPPVLCGSYVIRWESEPTDTFSLYIPLGSLIHTGIRVGSFPFGKDGGAVSLRRREPIDAWMARLGRYIYERVPFRHARIGSEVDDHRVEIETTDPPPDMRLNGYLLPRDGQLLYIPATT